MTLDLGQGLRSNLIQSLTWSLDGQRLAVSGPFGIKVWDAAGGDERLNLAGQFTVRGPNGLAWSPTAPGSPRLTP